MWVNGSNNKSAEASHFHWNHITVKQPQGVQKVGTDTLCLVAWISRMHIEPQTILDVGTGTGFIALCLGQRFPGAAITGIDINVNAVDAAKENFNNSVFKNRIVARYENIFDHSHELSDYDLVVSNPPFYTHQLEAKDEARNQARHSEHHPTVWMNALTSKTNATGKVGVVIPFRDSAEWIRGANANGFYSQKRCNLISHKGDDPIRSLLFFGREILKPEYEDIVLFASKGKYSSELIAFIHPE